MIQTPNCRADGSRNESGGRRRYMAGEKARINPMSLVQEIPSLHSEMLAQIQEADEDLTARFESKLRVNADLDRRLVSFQGNREEIGHRWFKYREGFSAGLIRYLIAETGIEGGTILDPFAGSGTAAITAAECGLSSIGIELLPSSAEIVQVRNSILHADRPTIARKIRDFMDQCPWLRAGEREQFGHLRITAGAFPAENERQLERYLFESSQGHEPHFTRILRFAAMCILEQISFTRKDGQYLRWDRRSGRCAGIRPFDKGPILAFDDAIREKLEQIANDIEGREDQPNLFPSDGNSSPMGEITLQVGSCLDLLPQMKANSISAVITSPPYCNRYDYTRTYALELAMMGIDEQAIRCLRQTMLSCTVENKDKPDLFGKFGSPTYRAASDAFESQHLLDLVIQYLEQCKRDGTINNPGIVRMVKNYFFELALLIFASARVLKPGAPFVMVNDNVRYQGAQVSVDLILSDFAEQAGYEVEKIWVLPKGKGNSSQQMGLHGRQETRKCVYVWRKR